MPHSRKKSAGIGSEILIASSGSVQAHREGARVLVADDNPINQIVIAHILRQLSYDYDIVDDGALALATVQARHYGVILMDIQMPIMDGVASTRAIRALPGPVGNITIIALTAFSDREQFKTYQSAGITDIVAKPIVAMDLYQKLNRYCPITVGPSDQS